MQGLYIFIAPVFRGYFFKTTFNTISRLFTLGKQERLKSRKLIEQLFGEGKSFSLFPFRVFYLYGENLFRFADKPTSIQAGFGVSAKNFKKSVDRNRIKRLTREAYRLQKEMIYQTVNEKKMQLALFIIYTGRELPDYKMVREKIGLTLQKLAKETGQH